MPSNDLPAPILLINTNTSIFHAYLNKEFGIEIGTVLILVILNLKKNILYGLIRDVSRICIK